MPGDLATALGPLRATWDGWPHSVRRGARKILLNAKKPETRAREVADIAAAARASERPLQWKKR